MQGVLILKLLGKKHCNLERRSTSSATKGLFRSHETDPLALTSLHSESAPSPPHNVTLWAPLLPKHWHLKQCQRLRDLAWSWEVVQSYRTVILYRCALPQLSDFPLFLWITFSTKLIMSLRLQGSWLVFFFLPPELSVVPQDAFIFLFSISLFCFTFSLPFCQNMTLPWKGLMQFWDVSGKGIFRKGSILVVHWYEGLRRPRLKYCVQFRSLLIKKGKVTYSKKLWEWLEEEADF